MKKTTCGGNAVRERVNMRFNFVVIGCTPKAALNSLSIPKPFYNSGQFV